MHTAITTSSADTPLRIHVHDAGQDCIHYDIANGQVVNCGPFQQGTWIGKGVVNKQFTVGGQIHFDNGFSCRHPIARIEPMPEIPRRYRNWPELQAAERLARIPDSCTTQDNKVGAEDFV